MMDAFAICGGRPVGWVGRVFVYSGLAFAPAPGGGVAGVQDTYRCHPSGPVIRYSLGGSTPSRCSTK